MEFEEDYSGYDDYIDLDRHWSGTKDYDHMQSQEAATDQFQDILFQRSNFYYVMDIQRTEKYINEMINELINEWGVSESFALRLLKKFSWNKDKALTHLTEDGNFEMMDTHVARQEKTFDCPICYSTEPVKEACSYDCGHLYCQECFKDYLKLAIQEAQPLKSCPQEGCKEILTPSIVEQHLKSDYESYHKYKKFLLKEVVDTSYNLLWCPAANCFNIIYLLRTNKDEKNLRNVRCECGHCFCFQCKDVAHRPLQCEKFRKWMGLVGGKDETLNIGWIKKNAKQCPQCKMSIEKNQGCMHMTCRTCKHEFCWLCLEDWKQHGAQTGGYYACNKYKASEKNMDDEERQYEKFSFYRDRFEQHWNAVEIARKKKEKIQKNFIEINNIVVEMKDDSFLKEALDLIIEVRRAITMTYAVGYYSHFDEVGKEMFEMQQSMLWAALDNLDKFTDDIEHVENMREVFVDVCQDTNHLAKKFNDYKANLNGRVSAVTAACNKLLKYIEGELQENEAQHAQKKQNNKKDKMQIEKKTDKKKEAALYESEYWYCAHCTFANAKASKKCEMCNQVKKVLKNPTF